MTVGGFYINESKLFILFLLFLILILQPHTVSAFDPLSDAQQAAANAIKSGFDLFLYGIGDSFYELGSGNSTNNKSETNTMLIQVIGFTIDPYKLDFVIEWQKVFIVSYVMLAIISLLFHGAKMAAGQVSYTKMTSLVLQGMIFPIAFLLALYLILQINFVITAFIIQSGLTILPLSFENVILYLVMAVIFFILSIIMFARNVIIIFFAAAGLGLVALYFMDELKDFIGSLCKYFLVIVFMQPILLFVLVAGTAFIQVIPPELINYRAIGAIAVGLIVIILAVTMLLGTGIFKLFVYKAVMRR